MNTESYTRIKLIKIWEILTEFSSEASPLTTTQVLNKLKEAGVPCDRRTLYGDVAVLSECGYEVFVVRGRENAYYTKKHNFSSEELFAVAESVRANRNISISKTNDIARRLPRLSFDKKKGKPSVKPVYPYLNKTVAGEEYEAVAKLLGAIDAGVCVRFTAIKRRAAGEKEDRGETFTVTPLEVVFFLGRYHLAYYDGNKISSVAIFDIADVKKVENPALSPALSAAAIRTKVVDSVCGKVEKVTFIADNGLIGAVIEQFGELVDFVKQGENKVSFTVEAPVNDQLFGWCMAKGGGIRINAPLKVKKRYDDFIIATYKKTFGE